MLTVARFGHIVPDVAHGRCERGADVRIVFHEKHIEHWIQNGALRRGRRA